MREIEDEKFIKKNKEDLALVERQNQKLIDFLDFLCSKVDSQSLLRSLSTPIVHDPLVVLARIQEHEDDDQMSREEEEHPQVLSLTFFNMVDREYVEMQKQKKLPQPKGLMN